MSEKILIIDDEQDIADLLEVYLKNENYIVYKFYCATDAMSCIESGDIDLAILDIMLPDMNGFSLCQLIRKKYTYPIIMLNASARNKIICEVHADCWNKFFIGNYAVYLSSRTF